MTPSPAELYGEARRRVEELSLLNEVGRAVAGSLDLREVLREAAEGARRLAARAAAYVILHDAARGELRFGAGAGTSTRLSRPARACGLRPGDRARPARGAARRPSRTSNGPTRASCTARHFGGRAFVAVPVLLRGEPLGVLVADEERAAPPLRGARPRAADRGRRPARRGHRERAPLPRDPAPRRGAGPPPRGRPLARRDARHRAGARRGRPEPRPHRRRAGRVPRPRERGRRAPRRARRGAEAARAAGRRLRSPLEPADDDLASRVFAQPRADRRGGRARRPARSAGDLRRADGRPRVPRRSPSSCATGRSAR